MPPMGLSPLRVESLSSSFAKQAPVSVAAEKRAAVFRLIILKMLLVEGLDLQLNLVWTETLLLHYKT